MMFYQDMEPHYWQDCSRKIRQYFHKMNPAPKIIIHHIICGESLLRYLSEIYLAWLVGAAAHLVIEKGMEPQRILADATTKIREK